MSIGMILLTVVAILVFFGVAQRVLDRLYLTDRAALILIALMFFGTLLPNLELGSVSLSVGGALIPFGICIYLLYRADTVREQLRAVFGATVTAVVVYALSALMPDEPERFVVDPMYVYGLAGGIIAYLLGRSRRNAFICGVLGVMFADIAIAIVNWSKGISQKLVLGGAGIFDVMMISGIIGVLLAEFVGELIERMSRGASDNVSHSVRHPFEHRKEKVK